jgi:hypothetical protein
MLHRLEDYTDRDLATAINQSCNIERLEQLFMEIYRRQAIEENLIASIQPIN